MPLFSERVSMLEVQNRALKKTARERADRIDELERELQHRQKQQQAAPELDPHIARRQREQAQHIAKLEADLQHMSQELERVKAEREFYCKQATELEEHNRLVTDAATKYSLWGQKLFRELATLDPDGAPKRKFDTGSWM